MKELFCLVNGLQLNWLMGSQDASFVDVSRADVSRDIS